MVQTHEEQTTAQVANDNAFARAGAADAFCLMSVTRLRPFVVHTVGRVLRNRALWNITRLAASSECSERSDVMTVPQKLSATQVQAADLADWRQILSRVKARFRTGDLMLGITLTNQIGQLASAAQAHPEITLTAGDVVVALSTPDVRGITTRDLDLARQISEAAAKLGVIADVSGLTQLELGLDTNAGEDLAPFYTALLGSEVQRGEPVDPSGQVPTVWWQNLSETDEDLALPGKTFEQRWHFDVWVPHDEAEHRLQAVFAAGGRLVSDAGAPSYWVVEDAEGNRSCICTPFGR